MSVETRPLTSHTTGDTLAWDESGSVTVDAFYRSAVRMAQSLPPSQYVVNTCQDRYLFMLGFAAALISGRPTLMPSSFTAGTLQQIQDRYPDIICLHDGTQRAEGLREWRISDTQEPLDADEVTAPEIDVNQVAAIVFTSGSTGEPTAHAKTWGRLCVNGASEAARLGSAEHTIVATVPAQHMYGFESSVLLAMHGGSSVWRGKPFYPADIAAALAASPRPRMLVTTPYHLSNLVGSGTEVPECDLLLCATAPLSTELAITAEALFSSPLFEIYGCTESGQVASRRTVSGPVWQLLPGLSMASDESGAWVSGGHVEGRVALTDQISHLGGDLFRLGDRHSDMVNIAGKRASLAALSATLRGLPGVVDASYLLPHESSASPTESIQRLAALVVAPALSVNDIITALRQAVDPAFLPRPLLKVDALPRNATGKVLANELQALFQRARAAAPAR